MNLFQAIILGLIQGLGEFLPISSSGHLVAAPWLFGFRDPGLAFDVALHLGTLIAVVLYFAKDFIEIIKNTFVSVQVSDLNRNGSKELKKSDTQSSKTKLISSTDIKNNAVQVRRLEPTIEPAPDTKYKIQNTKY